jgi:cytochrome b involved in lipid metabolism
MRNKIFIALIVLLVAGLVVFAISKNENPKIVPVKTDTTVQTVQTKETTTTTTSVKTASVTTPHESTSVPAPKPVTTVEVKAQAEVPKETVPTENTFTLQEVAQHSSEADCYSAIDGVVYDLTAWITEHPGGDRNILRICGIDGSKAYNSQHSGEVKANNILAGFEIGILKN